MRFRIVVALSVSVLLILGAFFHRQGGAEKSAMLASAEPASMDSAQAAAAIYSQGTSSEPTENLNATDLVGRQLILDYLNLASNGQATGDNLNLLAAQYVEKVPTVSAVTKLSLLDLNVVPDSQTTLEAYDKATDVIENARIASVKRAYSSIDSSNATNQELLKLASAIGAAYEKAANALQAMDVPESVASAHLDLVNNNLAIAYGLESASANNTDSTSAFAGMVLANSSMQEEKGLIDKIVAILVKNGL